MQPDLFPAPEKPKPTPRIGDCFLCAGERLCDDPAACYPADLPEEKRI